MTFPWPNQIATCNVSGRLARPVVDPNDPTNPAMKPLAGVLRFMASIRQTSTTGLPEELLAATRSPLAAKLDDDGRFSIDLYATDDPFLGVVDWTWRVEFQLEDCEDLAGFDFQLESGNSYLITDLVPVTESPGVITIRGPGGVMYINSVTTVPYGQGSDVVNVGTPEHALLDITLEGGVPGPPGPQGGPDTSYGRSFLLGGM